MIRPYQVVFLFSILVIFYSCNQSQSSSNHEEASSNEYTERLINQIQVIGSHNSYKKFIEDDLIQYLINMESDSGILKYQYDHIPIVDQLNLGLRNIEIDAYVDKDGGRYANPKGLELAKSKSDFDEEGKMVLPGFKILHIPDIDFRSHYFLLTDCLNDLRQWSDYHPEHEIVFINLEPKDGGQNKYGTTPEPYTPSIFRELDSTLFRHLGKSNIITPREVMAGYETLEEAVLNYNWPTTEEAKGKFLFILDTEKDKKDFYSSLPVNERAMFVTNEPGSFDAAVLSINNPRDKRIPKLVKKGYLVRTRADMNTKEARNNDYSTFEAAKKSGAQIISTDYYLPSKLFESSYQISFKGEEFIRENPLFE